jgi:hypothetical protein
MAKIKTGIAYREMKKSAEEFLLEHRAVIMADFEQHLFDRFHKKWEKGAFDDLEGKDRTRWENYTDHVKANLTKEGFTEYVKVQRVVYICHTPVRAQIYREGSFVLYGEHRTTMLALANQFNKDNPTSGEKLPTLREKLPTLRMKAKW